MFRNTLIIYIIYLRISNILSVLLKTEEYWSPNKPATQRLQTSLDTPGIMYSVSHFWVTHFFVDYRTSFKLLLIIQSPKVNIPVGTGKKNLVHVIRDKRQKSRNYIGRFLIKNVLQNCEKTPHTNFDRKIWGFPAIL